jgi:hypothetical protein
MHSRLADGPHRGRLLKRYALSLAVDLAIALFATPLAEDEFRGRLRAFDAMRDGVIFDTRWQHFPCRRILFYLTYVSLIFMACLSHAERRRRRAAFTQR